MIKGLAHLCFVVRDLGASLEFYCGKLGLEVAFESRRENGERYGVYLKVGGRSFMELFEGKVVPAAELQSYRHVCFEVDDMQAAVGELRGKGAEVTEPKVGKDRSWQAWMTDPDGNAIELHCYTGESKQGPHLR